MHLNFIIGFGARRFSYASIKMKQSATSSMKLTKEEELLLEQYGRASSNKSTKIIYGNALMVAAAPICESLFEMQLLIMFQCHIKDFVLTFCVKHSCTLQGFTGASMKWISLPMPSCL